MASPCKLNKNIFYVHVYKRTYYVNNILYIYIIYVNMKTIIYKKKVLDFSSYIYYTIYCKETYDNCWVHCYEFHSCYLLLNI